MNRFTIKEDASFELMGVHHVPYESSVWASFFKKIIRLSTKMPNRNIRESENHFIFAVNGLNFNLIGRWKNYFFNILSSKLHIKLALVTILTMSRHNLITKERMEVYPKGKSRIKKSVHDDLDHFVEKLQHQKFKYKHHICKAIPSYFLPKLTEEEKQLVESKNTEFMQTLLFKDPNEILRKMKKSKSETMYVRGICWRQTFHVDKKWAVK